MVKPDAIRIAYLTQAGVPSHLAHAKQIVRMCQGFAADGVEITLFACPPNQIGSAAEWRLAIERQYGSIDGVRLIEVPQPRPGRPVAGLLRRLQSAFRMRQLVERARYDLVYTRDAYLLGVGIPSSIPAIMEEHVPPRHLIDRWMRRRSVARNGVAAVVFITNALRRYYSELGIYAGRPHVIAPDGCSEQEIARGWQRQLQKSRAKTVTRPRVGYIGRLHRGRGIELISQLAAMRPDIDFVLVGSVADAREAVPERPNLEIIGYMPAEELALVMDDLDVLLMPYENDTQTAGGRNSAMWMSPLKMFEYLASGIPFIASDLPVLQEVLVHERNCLLAAPGAAATWAACVDRLVESPGWADELASNALRDAELYRWDRRAAQVVSALKS